MTVMGCPGLRVLRSVFKRLRDPMTEFPITTFAWLGTICQSAAAAIFGCCRASTHGWD
jgi:hypothetical protein